MKPEFLGILHCIRCFSTDFFPEIHQAHGSEWMEGNIVCGNCGLKYRITGGILDVYIDMDRHYEAEYAAFLHSYETSTVAQMAEEEKEKFVLGLPDTAEDPYTSISFTETLEYMGPLPGKKVLDLGSGLSWTTRDFAGQGAHAVALEMVDHQLHTAGLYFQDSNIYFERVRGDMEHLPFCDQVFDIVFSRASVHHSRNLMNIFREIARVLVPGGHVFLSQEPVFGVFQRRALKEFGEVERTHGAHESCYTTFEWKTAMTLAHLDNRFIFLSMGLNEKIRSYQIKGRYTNLLFKFLSSLLMNPALLKLVKICYISPLHYLYPVNMLITGTKN